MSRKLADPFFEELDARSVNPVGAGGWHLILAAAGDPAQQDRLLGRTRFHEHGALDAEILVSGLNVDDLSLGT